MNAKRSSYLFVIVSLLALLTVSILIAGCTSNGTTATPSTPVPTAASSAANQAAAPAPAAAPAGTISTVAPVTSVAPGQTETITVSGSTTVQPIAQDAADAFMKLHPEADIQVSGGGSGVGIQAISAGSVNIGMSSVDLTTAQKAKIPHCVVTTVAQDGIAIIVNPQNTLNQISLSDVASVYTGKYMTWNVLNGANVPGTNNQIVLVGRDTSSGTRTYFDQTVLNNGNPATSMLQLNSNGAVEQTVAQTPQAIGYVSIGFLSPDVKALSLFTNGGVLIPANVATVANHIYPISRNLYMITQGQPTGLTADYINFILSPAGQQIVAKDGYVPLPASQTS
jgi:phosphate transport system substrate-binding protein